MSNLWWKCLPIALWGPIVSDSSGGSFELPTDECIKIKDPILSHVFPGHGEYIEHLPNVISTYRAHHRQRMGLVWNALKEKSRPLYHLIDDVFPSVPEDDVFLAVSEIFVHLEILIDEGRAELGDPGPPALYRAL